MTRDFKLSDLRTIVPTATPAWIRVIEAHDVRVGEWSARREEDESVSKEWQDNVLAVLAYAVLPNGFGAFLVCPDSGGPGWCTHS